MLALIQCRSEWHLMKWASNPTREWWLQQHPGHFCTSAGFALARIIVVLRVCSWMWPMTMPLLQQHEWYLRTLQKLSSRGEASKWGPSKFLHVLWLIKDVVSSATVSYYQVLEVDKSTGSRYNPCAWGMSLVNKWKRRDPLWVLGLLFDST